MPSERPKSPDEEAAHDVLAAEAFAVPAPDPDLHHEHVVLPDDPSGIEAPHDILAAEEFAMPAAPARSPVAGGASAARARRTVMGAAAGLLALLGARRHARR
jgi:hypothetical protein